MKIKTKPRKTLKKFKKLPMAFIPQFHCIKEVSIKKVNAKKKKIELTNLDKVTVDKILKVIEKRKTVKGKKIRWKLVNHAAVRAVIGSKLFCPITFYCYMKTGQFFFCEEVLEVYEAVKKCGIIGIGVILRASDGNTSDNKDAALRQKLLQATGLLEQARKNE